MDVHKERMDYQYPIFLKLLFQKTLAIVNRINNPANQTDAPGILNFDECSKETEESEYHHDFI